MILRKKIKCNDNKIIMGKIRINKIIMGQDKNETLFANLLYECYKKKVNGMLTENEKRDCEWLVSQYRIPGHFK
jgi:hypothetical protein